jgi:hypothetical protein
MNWCCSMGFGTNKPPTCGPFTLCRCNNKDELLILIESMDSKMGRRARYRYTKFILTTLYHIDLPNVYFTTKKPFYDILTYLIHKSIEHVQRDNAAAVRIKLL